MTKRDQIWLRSMEWGSRMGCHQMPERSFFWNKRQAPVCARCTGLLLGYVIALLSRHWCKPRTETNLLFCMLMFVDGMLQRTGICQSTNSRRLCSGLLCGFGMTHLQLQAIGSLWRLLTKRNR